MDINRKRFLQFSLINSLIILAGLTVYIFIWNWTAIHVDLTALQQFEAGSFVKFNADASFMTVDPETGVVDGKEDADIAEFILNAKGSIGILKLQNLKIDPVKIVQ